MPRSAWFSVMSVFAGIRPSRAAEIRRFGRMPEAECRRIRPSEAVHAFIPSMSDAHAVASHIVLTLGLDTMVGLNESSRGEGYVMVEPAIDIWKVVKQVTGSDIQDEPDGFRVPQNI